MRERGATFADVEHALAGARRCSLQENGRWRVDKVAVRLDVNRSAAR
jgi:hypothetical protein